MKAPELSCEKCFEDFRESLEELGQLVRESEKHSLTDSHEKRLIRSFEVTHELALNTIGEFFRKQSRPPFTGSRDATVEAFNEDLIDDGKGWMDMIIDRIKYNPLYPEEFDHIFLSNIKKIYYRLLLNFERKMKEKLE
ncbi:nucleotidyltransferase substrate binding protein, HI0074 family [Indibacter alkaliphilus LW1]|jgi:hypothetical protein|uniref:Nucleotidyltransferase substrate binding protein, HI0074 family n=1 Tax=Indibacter alkaliphilus (strain CCUG 57479 / KCTC 22604 / LW1) TaxID=1189612 RepID=S2DL51_INDAL|nr:nucleotidyltransferase substrate binding protein [Indibacter alkaliphilus]EOZ99667.1 nucleotidyltransferase substrate binding protein, HI0074 family [Indibacter alkaliphilus LW1]